VDVQPQDWYYQYVAALHCRNVITGYDANPPCRNGTPCFDPQGKTTRGQMSKIAALAFNLPINTAGGPHFSDVQPGSTFYNYIETLFNMGTVSGYGDGTFRPSSQVTRGQLTKILVFTARSADPGHWQLQNPPIGNFEDVPTGSTFYEYIETAYSHGIINGYPCGVLPAGQCVPPNNKPYFVSYGNATRAQISKIASMAADLTRMAAEKEVK